MYYEFVSSMDRYFAVDSNVSFVVEDVVVVVVEGELVVECVVEEVERMFQLVLIIVVEDVNKLDNY